MDEHSCGLFGYRPKCLQRFATVRWFLVVFSLLGTIQSMTYAYFPMTLTTMEKRFKASSQAFGVAMSGNEISQIMFGLILSYYGSSGNRPVYMAIGSACSALSTFILFSIHLIYGPGEDALKLTEEYEYKLFVNLTNVDDGLCHAKLVDPTACTTDNPLDNSSLIPLVLIFLSQFVVGVGSTLYYIYGLTYLDDNSEKSSTPKLIATSIALRMVGPIFGVALTIYCLNIYIDPSSTPLITPKDPRWIGAWWLGWPICGVPMLLFSVFIGLFPKELPKPKANAADEVVPLRDTPRTVHPTPKLKEFPSTLLRLLKNRIITLNMVASVFYLLGAAGFMTYSMKYLEIQFHVSSSTAGGFGGTFLLSGMVLGLIVSGHVLSYFKPRAAYVLGWSVIIGCVSVVSHLAYMTINCDQSNLMTYGNQLYSSCNANCSCSGTKFSPVCRLEDKMTFYSACHAGCTSTTPTDNRTYENCSCANDATLGSVTIQEGYCVDGCTPQFSMFIAICFFASMAAFTGKVGNILVNYRAIDEKDKSFVQGITLWVLSLFAFIPGPILYGYIFDHFCIIWDETACGRRGNCMVYDKDGVRVWFNLVSVFFIAIAVMFDCFVWKYGRNLDLYETPLKDPVRDPVGDDKLLVE